MAERPMEHFTVDGVNIFEITDAQARTDISDIKNDLEAIPSGVYPNMVTGGLVGDSYTEDKIPYLFRNSHSGKAQTGSIVGGTVAWNQLMNVETYTNTITDTRDYLSFMIQVYSGTTATTFKSALVTGVGVVSGITSAPVSGDCVRFKHNGATQDLVFGQSTGAEIISGHKYLWSAHFTGIDATTVGGLSVKNLMFSDLTQMFGSTIADYIYSLETATAGAGVAWFRSLFPLDYYEYNSGELKHVSGLTSHDTVGFNQFDKSTAVPGRFDADGIPSSDTNSHVSDWIRAMPNTVYYVANVVAGTAGRGVCVYDANKNYIMTLMPQNSYSAVTGRITTPSNCSYMRIQVPNANLDNASVNLSNPARNGEYEAYVKHTYALDSDLTLRGIPKLDSSNELYYDGDTYEPDGTVTRKYGIVDMGTLSWTIVGNDIPFFYTTLTNWSFPTTSTNVIAPLICSKYVTTTQTLRADKTICGYNNGTDKIMVSESDYATATEFTSAMSGVYLVYELATETTESADAYEEYQIVEADGTEQFVSTGIVPVGHDTKYYTDLGAKAETIPDAPTTDGTYTLTCTVSSGVPTYTWS